MLPNEFSPRNDIYNESTFSPSDVIVPIPEEEMVSVEDLLPLSLLNWNEIASGATKGVLYLADISPQGSAPKPHLA